MSDVPNRMAAELLEALIHHAMAEHASIQPRGFDSIKQRALIHHEIDVMLDKWLTMRAPVA